MWPRWRGEVGVRVAWAVRARGGRQARAGGGTGARRANAKVGGRRAAGGGGAWGDGVSPGAPVAAGRFWPWRHNRLSTSHIVRWHHAMRRLENHPACGSAGDRMIVFELRVGRRPPGGLVMWRDSRIR
eukprot:28697-Prymnesium_polylepis.1